MKQPDSNTLSVVKNNNLLIIESPKNLFNTIFFLEGKKADLIQLAVEKLFF